MSANDDYVNTLKAELAKEQAYRKAVVDEFKDALTSNEKDFSPEDLKKKFYALLPTAYERLTYLMNNADSEAVQLGAIKYVFNIATGQVKITGDNDPDAKMTELLSQLVNPKD